MDLYLAIKNNDLKRVENIIARGFDIKEWELYEKISFVSLAILNGNFSMSRTELNSNSPLPKIMK